MLSEAHKETRRAAERRRRPPGNPVFIRATFDRGLHLGNEAPAPTDLTVEATNADREPAEWFDDVWWTALIELWGNAALTLHIAPTPAALLHPVVLHQIEMVSRVAPRWRIVGHAYRDEVITDDAVEALARSPYHEVRFIDQGTPSARQGDRCDWAPTLQELFGRIRREQSRRRAVRPILVRLPAQSADVRRE